ncbi:hypothetical protein CHUAL_009422 [Chamberlinius hualienensis]
MATGKPEDASLFSNHNISNSASVTDDLSNRSNEKNSTEATSPSNDSVSSFFLAGLKGGDDFFLDTKDLMVRVDNPEKHSSTIESYITFRVLTKTTRSEYDSHEYSVRRRYNDFAWLKQKLEDNYPTHIIPPLPEKHRMQRLSHFNAEFIKVRMTGLNKFLMRVADHPVLSFDKSLQLFLTAKPFEFAAHKKEGAGFLGRMSNSFQNLAAAYMMRARPPEFDQLNDYLGQFGEKLGTLERINDRIIKEQTDMISELKEYHPVFTLWASSENQLNEGLSATGAAVDASLKSQQAVVDAAVEDFSQPLREYILYTNSVQESLKRRDAQQIEYELTVEELVSKKAEKEQVPVETTPGQSTLESWMGKDPEQTRRDKLEKINRSIDSLTNQSESNNDKLESANASLRSDVERWHATKREDMRAMFMNMANRQIDYYQKCLAAWEEAIPQIRDCGNNSEPSVAEELDK